MMTMHGEERKTPDKFQIFNDSREENQLSPIDKINDFAFSPGLNNVKSLLDPPNPSQMKCEATASSGNEQL